MNAKRKLCVLIVLLGGWSFSHSQILGLDSILGIIEANNPELKAYDSRVKALEFYATGARSYEPPQLGAGFFMTPYNVSMWKSDAMTASPGMGAFMITAQQMFTHPKKLRANALFMQSMANVDKEMKNVMRNELFAMAKMNYYEWLVLKKKLAVLKESESLLQYVVKSTEIRYTYSMDPLNAVYKAKAMLGDIQNMSLMTEYEVIRLRIALNTLMNRDQMMLFDIDTTYSIKFHELRPPDTALIRNERSDIRAFEQEIQFLKAKQNYERTKLKPDFGIKYDHMLAFGTQPQQFSIMAMVTIPIAPWSSKMYRSSVQGLNDEIDAVKFRRQSLLNTASGDLYGLTEQIKSKKLQIQLYEKNILPSMKNNQKTVLRAYEQNTEELFMVLDAWQNLKLVQLSYLDLLHELLQLQVQYEKEREIK